MDTPVSLLERLRRPLAQEDWARFAELYTPLIYSWARRAGVPTEDAADLVQDVFVTLLQKLPEFAYDRHQSFRAWLRAVTLNRWRDNCRRRPATPLAGNGALAAVPGSDGLDAFWDAEYHRHLVGRALKVMQAEFEPATWKACWECVACGRSAAEVAALLGISENAVYIARCRVLRRLRRELAGLMD